MIRRRQFLGGLLASPLYFIGMGALRAKTFRRQLPNAPQQTKFAFGSCNDQTLEGQPIWKIVEQQNPQFFTFIGDNIYADTYDMEHMAEQYRICNLDPDFARFRSKVPIIATWDDHDFGWNDIGAEYPMKHQSKELMLDFFNEPKDSDRRKRDGVYTSYFFGEAPNRMQVILLDLRWFRSALKIDENGYYIPNDDPAATLLGEEQWQWLEAELQKPADCRILASSIQFVSSEHRWEKWANFPNEKRRLMEMLDRYEVRNLFVISGDMHFAELSAEKTPDGYDLYDLTASGLNYYEPSAGIENSKRLQLFDSDSQFGVVTVDWTLSQVSLQIYDSRGNRVIEKTIGFESALVS